MIQRDVFELSASTAMPSRTESKMVCWMPDKLATSTRVAMSGRVELPMLVDAPGSPAAPSNPKPRFTRVNVASAGAINNNESWQEC